MADYPLLSELCRICSTNRPKYCCPRCACQTCSLPCYKRHKTWAQCSGKRDPAAYMKRSQLATPAGIDHDYNFLTGIERAFDNADRNAKHQGLGTARSQRGETSASRKLQSCITDARVYVRKAPKGMSRQKENQTQCRNRDGLPVLSWTVEWILPDGLRKLKNSLENETLEDAYREILKSRKATWWRSRKRKRNARALKDQLGEPQEAIENEADNPQRDEPFAREQISVEFPQVTPLGNGHSPLESQTLGPVDAPTEVAKLIAPVTATEELLDNFVPDEGSVQEKVIQQNASTDLAQSTQGLVNAARDEPDNDLRAQDTEVSSIDIGDSNSIDQNPAASTPQFYLHRPLSASPSLVLIPLTSTQTLREVLAGRTVLEFPTIHVLQGPLPELGPGMLLEQDYLRDAKKMIEELDDELRPLLMEAGLQDAVHEDETAREVPLQPLDESQILETLRRDVAAAGR